MNGGLELNAGDSFVTVLSVSSYGSWDSVGNGDVEFIREGHSGAGPVAEGSGFVDSNGVGFDGAISQTLSTTSGVPYLYLVILSIVA